MRIIARICWVFDEADEMKLQPSQNIRKLVSRTRIVAVRGIGESTAQVCCKAILKPFI